ncbi:MAG: MBL fold metallo-hydrolase [Muribaculaceae bacterium]|nr:MBL fold metallo-hydrolase [Muribaculaceae bacterium]
MAMIQPALSACGNNSTSTVDCQEFEKAIQLTHPLTILDVRTPEEYASGHIPGAINVNFFDEDFVDRVKQVVPEGDSLAIYCKSGRRSAQAHKALEATGDSIIELAGGIEAWEKERLPITTGKTDIYITPEGKKLEIEPLIHASLRIVYDGKEIEIDPVGTLGDRTTDYSAFPKADLILVTHEHHDHLDPAAIETLSKRDTIVVTNPNSAKILGYGMVMSNGDRKEIDGIGIEAVPAYNVSEDRLQFHPKGRDNGYVLEIGGMKIYIAGDTEVIPEMASLKDIDIAFLPCNLPYTMTPSQFIEAAEIIKPRVVYPYHYGTTDLSSLIPALAPQGIYVRICPFDPGA